MIGSTGIQAGQNSWESHSEWAHDSGHNWSNPVSYAILMSWNLDDGSNCEAGTIIFPNRKTLGGQAVQVLKRRVPQNVWTFWQYHAFIGCAGQGVRQEPGGQLGRGCGVGIQLYGMSSNDSTAVKGADEDRHKPDEYLWREHCSCGAQGQRSRRWTGDLRVLHTLWTLILQDPHQDHRHIFP